MFFHSGPRSEAEMLSDLFCLRSDTSFSLPGVPALAGDDRLVRFLFLKIVQFPGSRTRFAKAALLVMPFPPFHFLRSLPPI
jgi:hypothetical protein